MRLPSDHEDDPRDSDRIPQSLDLNLLRTFLVVYRAGSFTAAASRLGLSQPTVTTQVRSLEKRLGAPLFRRLPRGVEPVPRAHDLARRIGPPLDALAGLDEHAASSSHRVPVRLAGPSEVLCTRVMPALAPLVARGVQLRVGQGLTDPLLSRLRAGAEDLVIATRRPRGQALTSEPLWDEVYVLVAAPRWVPDRRTGVEETADLLRGIPLVGLDEQLPIVRRYWRTVLGRPVPGAGVGLTAPNLHALVAAVASGAGYSVLPRSLCLEHLAAGRMVLVHDLDVPPLNTFFLVRRPGSETNPDVRTAANAITAIETG